MHAHISKRMLDFALTYHTIIMMMISVISGDNKLKLTYYYISDRTKIQIFTLRTSNLHVDAWKVDLGLCLY